MHAQSRLPHIVRGSSAALLATFAALFSHVLGGGEMPGVLGIAAPLILSLFMCVLLAGRKLSLMRLSLSVIASQTLFHTLFVLGTPRPGSAVQQDMSGGPHHHAQAMMPLPMLSDQTVTLLPGDALMTVSHFIGAAITILFLFRGEQTLHRLRTLAERFVAWMQHRLVSPLAIPVEVARERRYVAEATSWSVLSQIRDSAQHRRGPPVAVKIAR